MRKLVIPATLCGLVIVGAVLLLLPVEDAMAVHSTIAANINKQDRYVSFYISANATGSTNVVIIPAKAGNALIVGVSTIDLDGTGGLVLFETTASLPVASGGTLETLASGVGLQIADIKANSEHFVSVVVASDVE